MLSKLDQLLYQEELARKKRRAHDVLGQRFAILQQLLRGGHAPMPAAIARSIDSLTEELKSDSDSPDEPLLERLCAVYAGIGVDVSVCGALPAGEAGTRLFAIIRECCTNAVRHGLASGIEIHIDRVSGGSVLAVSNNGKPAKGMRYGSGIEAMRKSAEDTGGYLEVDPGPVFTVKAIIMDGGTNNDTNTDR